MIANLKVTPVAAEASPINPLMQYSLQGQGSHLEEQAVAQKPLLGSFSLTGQGTVICAPPNAGKTLITLAVLIEAIQDGRIKGDDVFYVDADDTTQGVADKVHLLDEYGVHVLAEGYRGFKTTALAPALEEMIGNGSAHGKLLILDTFKKFTQLMSKVETSKFTHIVRRFVLAGGSLLCLAHTNKSQDAQGRNVFAGVSDIIDDLDCAYVLDVKPDRDGKRIVQFTNKKRRGNNPDSITYAYAPNPELSYLDRLTSVHETQESGELDDTAFDHRISDEEALQTLALYIRHGPNRGKMALVRATADHLNIPKNRALRLLEDNTGVDPVIHLWRFVVRARGRHSYELHDGVLERLQP